MNAQADLETHRSHNRSTQISHDEDGTIKSLILPLRDLP